jgi:cytoskeletal protein CcmA (bactofilin family)
MKKLFTTLLSTLFILFCLAQDKIVYDANAEQREAKNFHAIKISHGIELLLKQGSEEAMAISAEGKELRDAVKTEVVNGELRIYVKQDVEKWWRQLRSQGKKVKAYVSFKNLDRIDASSGSKTTIDGRLSADDLSINISSGAHVNGEIKANELEIDGSSGAVTTIKGNVQELEIRASSGAHLNGYDLVAEKGKANASSGGKIELSVNKEIAANASSGGAITYKGESAAVREHSTSSGGKIRRAG